MLATNFLQSIPYEFSGTIYPKLISMDLAINRIEAFHINMLASLTALQSLNLQYNRIIQLPTFYPQNSDRNCSDGNRPIGYLFFEGNPIHWWQSSWRYDQSAFKQRALCRSGLLYRCCWSMLHQMCLSSVLALYSPWGTRYVQLDKFMYKSHFRNDSHYTHTHLVFWNVTPNCLHVKVLFVRYWRLDESNRLMPITKGLLG